VCGASTSMVSPRRLCTQSASVNVASPCPVRTCGGGQGSARVYVNS
jgi:hypothetical protein